MRKLGQNNEHWGAMAGMAANAFYRYQGRPVNVFHEIESKPYKFLGHLKDRLMTYRTCIDGCRGRLCGRKNLTQQKGSDQDRV
jgi:hypothetical protein